MYLKSLGPSLCSGCYSSAEKRSLVPAAATATSRSPTELRPRCTAGPAPPKGLRAQLHSAPHTAAHSPGKAEDQPGSPPASSCAEAKSESCGCFYQTTPTRSHSSVIIKLLLLIHRFCLKKKKKGERMKCKKNKCFRKQNVGVLHVAARMTELCEAH